MCPTPQREWDGVVFFLGVLWLLWSEHADVKLLLALIYIML